MECAHGLSIYGTMEIGRDSQGSSGQDLHSLLQALSDFAMTFLVPELSHEEGE